MLWIPAYASLAFKSFFYGDRDHRRLRYALVGGVPSALLFALSCIAWAGGSLLGPYTDAVVYVVGGLSVLLTGYLLHVALWMYHLIFDLNPRAADSGQGLFPRRFAVGTFWIPMVVQAITWVVFALGDISLTILLTICIILAGAAFLVVILHPQRAGSAAVCVNGQAEAEDTALLAASPSAGCEPASGPDEEKTEKISPQLIDKIERQIRDAVERDRLFLDPDLSKSTLATRIGVNKHYLYIALRLRFGRFNTYVNSLRLKYALCYEAEHPGAKAEEIALNCGFGSVRTYFRTKKDCGSLLHEDAPLPKSEPVVNV